MNANRERLRDDIETNATFGAIEVKRGHGRTVLTGTGADEDARRYLVERLEDAGLDVRVDAVGNIRGRWIPDGVDPDAASVAAGSHLDSVREGGIFDGPLGVYAALEAVRTINDAGVDVDRPVDVVSFTEEEGGRHGIGLLGSSVAVGERSAEEALALTDVDGTTLEENLDRIGFRGEGVIDASAWDAWLEVHVEQATKLESAGVPVGVVTAITGITNCQATIDGEANHAGATPMFERTDALTAAAEFVLDVERAARECVLIDSESAVGTVGVMDVEPGSRNVIPGRVTIELDIRDVERASMDDIVARLRKSLARLEATRGVTTDLDRYRFQPPQPMSDRCREAIIEAARAIDVEAMEMHSAAGHDTQNVAAVTDAGLLFVPSRDGISHNPLEWTDWEECTRAASVLAGALVRLAGE